MPFNFKYIFIVIYVNIHVSVWIYVTCVHDSGNQKSVSNPFIWSNRHMWATQNACWEIQCFYKISTHSFLISDLSTMILFLRKIKLFHSEDCSNTYIIRVLLGDFLNYHTSLMWNHVWWCYISSFPVKAQFGWWRHKCEDCRAPWQCIMHSCESDGEGHFRKTKWKWRPWKMSAFQSRDAKFL